LATRKPQHDLPARKWSARSDAEAELIKQPCEIVKAEPLVRRGRLGQIARMIIEDDRAGAMRELGK
jgi:hypothetical protein